MFSLPRIFLLGGLLFLSRMAGGQCDAYLDPGMSCLQAPLISAEDLNAGNTYCSFLPLDNAIDELNPFCNNVLGTSENTAFFQFYPETSALTFTISPYSCDTLNNSSGSFTGMQTAVFPACDYNNKAICYAGCQNQTFDLQLNDLQPGQLYIMAFDGCNGSICSFNISLSDGMLMGSGPTGHYLISGPEQVCANESAVFSLTQLPANAVIDWTLSGNLSYNVSNNGKVIEIGNLGQAGIYQITPTINLDPPNGAVLDTTLLLEVLEAPLIQNISPDTTLCPFDEWQINLAAEYFDEVIWNGGDTQLSCTDCLNPILVVAEEDLLLSVTLTNSATGCVVTKSLDIDVVASANCTNATNDFEFEEFVLIYPNPAKDYLNLKTNFRYTSLKLYDAAGKYISTFDLDLKRIDLRHLSQGVFYLEIIDKDLSKKILKVLKK